MLNSLGIGYEGSQGSRAFVYSREDLAHFEFHFETKRA